MTDKERSELLKLRFSAYSSAIGFLKPGTTLEKFLPLDGDLKPMDKTEAQKLVELYQSFGYLKQDDQLN